MINLYKVIMAVGSTRIEEDISAISNIHTEAVSDIEMIQEILEYESYDYIIVNSLLSKRKIVQLADYAENMDCRDKPKIIVLTEDMTDKKFVTQLVGFGVHAFVNFNEIALIGKHIERYPESFSLSRIEEMKSGREISTSTVINGTISIGVFNIDRGAGSTSCSLKVAEEIANCGYRTVCIEIGETSFSFLNKKKLTKTLELVSTSVEEKDGVLQIAFADNSYQFIVIDFGQIIKTDVYGNITETKQKLMGDFFRCNYKIGMCFASPWHNEKMNLFLKNGIFEPDLANEQMFIVTSGEEKYINQIIEDYHELPLWSRTEMEFFKERFKQRIGINSRIATKEKRKLFKRKGK